MKTTITPKNISLSQLEISSFEKLHLNFVRIVNEQLRIKNLNKSWLAHKLKVSAPVVTKLLSGKSNPTLKTIAEVSDILKIDLRLVMLPKEESEEVTNTQYSGRDITFVKIRIK